MIFSALRTLALTIATVGLASGELASWGDAIPRTGKPPVVFVTGHDSICPSARSGELPFFQLTFGDFDKVMARDGRVSLVFEACYAANRPPIEDIANLLGQLIAQLRHDNGEPVPEVDVVAHSMGGLIVRSYLAGKQSDGRFVPPAVPRVRRAVFLGTPHFGTHVAHHTSTDPQLREMALGSQFLFDLATWNQGRDDLRGVEALSIVGTAGTNGPATDSVVNVVSASLGFVNAGRTAVLSLCHTQGGIGNLFLCNGQPGLARVSDENHPAAAIVLSFLNRTNVWTLNANSASTNLVLAQTSGLILQARTADDVPRAIRSARVLHDNAAATTLDISVAGLAYADVLPSGPARLVADELQRRIVLPPGGSHAYVIKPGPSIEAVEPAPGAARPLALAPGMLVNIRGLELNSGATELYVAGKAVPILSAAPERLVAVVPENLESMTELRVRNAAGQHTVRVIVERAFPVLFRRDGLAASIHPSSNEPVTSANPARSGEIISLFLTGLGATTPQGGLAEAVHRPAVNIEGRPCEVLYAGRAPTLPGVDQINCRVPLDTRTGMLRFEVVSGNRTDTAELPVR